MRLIEYIISLEGPITQGRVVLKLFLDQSLGQADYMDWFRRQLCVVQGGGGIYRGYSVELRETETICITALIASGLIKRS